MADVLPRCWSDEEARRHADLIDAALRRGGTRLRFPHVLEERFEIETGPERCRGFRRYGLMGFVLCNMFLLNYFELLPDVAWRELQVQIVFMMPLVVAVTAYMRTEPPVFQREMTQSCVAMIALVGPMIAYQGSACPAAIFFRYAPILTLLYINVVAAIRFRFALPASMIAVLCNLVDLRLLDGVSSNVKGMVATSVITSCGFTLLANRPPSASRSSRSTARIPRPCCTTPTPRCIVPSRPARTSLPASVRRWTTSCANAGPWSATCARP